MFVRDVNFFKSDQTEFGIYHTGEYFIVSFPCFRMRYPPYSDFKTKGLTFLMRHRSPLPAWLNKLVIFGLGLATGYAARVITSRIFRITFVGKLLYRMFKFLVPGQPAHSLTAPAGPK